MPQTERQAGFQKLREPFLPNQINTLPKPYSKDSPREWCNECKSKHGMPAAHLDYVGHAAASDRLLDVDPEWTWEPFAVDASGLPALDRNGGLWIRLTVLGVTRPGYGDAGGKNGANAVKEAIGDAIRNAAMRFGVALGLWHKGDLHDTAQEIEPEPPSPAEEAKADLLETLKFKDIDPALAVEKFAADRHGELRASTDVAAIKALTQHYRGVK
ncbi:hypothetical protein ASH04_06800 [Rhodococcus sp. Leaf233]|nr:hypothetical protein ASH04_06800 [Rhodococcus sp. Leaf233]